MTKETPGIGKIDDAPLVRSPGGGLLNPLIEHPVLDEPAPGEKRSVPEPAVGEPRWQVTVSLIIVILFFLFWLLPFILNIFIDRKASEIINPQPDDSTVIIQEQ